MTPFSFSPSPEQEAILQAAKGTPTSLMVQAGAGCAKSTTLEMLAHALPGIPALGLAFNVKIKKELEKRFPSNFSIKTLNGLGHSAWQRAIGRMPKVDDKKLGKLVSEVFKEAQYQESEDDWTIVRQLVSAAMHRGLIPSKFPQQGLVPDTELEWQDISDSNLLDARPEHLGFAREVLIQNIKLSYEGTITYDDQIYMSALFGGVFPRFPLVMVDEAQDLSPLNHIQIKRSAADRLIVVGDPKQAIYAFRGADSSSMDNLRALRPEWIDLPLLTTFRCPKLVVARQQGHVPGYTAAPANGEGKIIELRKPKDYAPEPGTYKEWSWDWSTIEELLPRPDASIFVLCRNTAPLLSLAFKLLRNGIGCVVLGRDIGKNLVTLSKKIIPDDSTNIDACVGAIERWMEHEIHLARANEKEEKISGIEDRGHCLLAVAEGSGAQDARALRKAISDLFNRETGRVELATIHRAKGLEKDLVLHLDPWRIPSKYARRAASRGDRSQLEQELNLRYVCETRTKHTLVMANLEDWG